MRIPAEDKKWSGCFEGNYEGNLWASLNIDLERYPGRIALGPRMKREISGLGVVLKFIRTDAGPVTTPVDQWYGLVNNNIIKNGSTLPTGVGTWADDSTSGSPIAPLDAEVHESVNGEQRLIVTTSTDIAILNSSGAANIWDPDWGSTVPGIPIPASSVSYRPIARLQRLLAIGNKVSGIAKIDTIDKDDVVSLGRLTFGTSYIVKNIYTSSNRYWIGLMHLTSGKAKIVEWDGFSPTYNNEYELDGTMPLCGFIVDDIPYFITERGTIFKYNGGGFKEVQNFGLFKEHRIVLGEYDLTNYGAAVDGHLVYLNVNMPTLQSFSATGMIRGARRQRAGVWIFNTRTLNLYHHAGFGEYASIGTDINYGNSPLTLGASGTEAGAIIKVGNSLTASASVYSGGATWQAGSVNGIYQSFPNDAQGTNLGRNRGYFITPFLPISEVEGMWEALIVKFKRFVNANNLIVVKWRVLDPLYNASALDQDGNMFEQCISASMTWVNTTSFTCKVPTGVSVGDEVEILTGDNAGCSFKISAMSATPDNSTLITVTISEAAPTSSTDTCAVRFDNWKTETAITATDIGNKKVPFTAPAHGEFVQLKVELRGFDVQIDELIPVYKNKTEIKQT